MPLVQLEQVSKSFANKGEKSGLKVLEKLDLTVQEGEFVVVQGPSGCGKSTLLRLIAGLEKPTTGECFFAGETIRKPSLERGYVFQEPRLFPWLTVLENIELAGAGEGERLLRIMALEDFAKAYPRELSGGMAQRVALARALAARPKLLLLDEPLANLDLALRAALQSQLRQIWEREGITCILVTHDLSEALKLGTRLIVLSKRPGKIRQDFKLTPSTKISLLENKVLQDQLLNWMEV